MSDLIDTTEMYLRTIYELAEEGIVPLRARIAERLGHSGPTVSQTVARMERDGLVIVSGDRHLELTEAGHLKAVRVMRKHRLAERLLTDVIGLEWSLVHEEACRWEHVMSERVEERLVEILDHPHFSPYGNPIPGLDDLGVADPGHDVEGFLDGVVVLPDLRSLRAGGGPHRVVVRRLGEPLQTDIELLGRFAAAGVLPGADVDVTVADGLLTLASPGSATVLELPEDLARHVFVSDTPA
ncbi:iron dependent repressor, metal binding and dimerization domain protein [Actinotalea sp.]|uniref:metal-dependent transcriptional regulator n=1 Tax=Actinotalea sp. TaxID=1872145 RepID=UPI0035687ED4